VNVSSLGVADHAKQPQYCRMLMQPRRRSGRCAYAEQQSLLLLPKLRSHYAVTMADKDKRHASCSSSAEPESCPSHSVAVSSRGRRSRTTANTADVSEDGRLYPAVFHPTLSDKSVRCRACSSCMEGSCLSWPRAATADLSHLSPAERIFHRLARHPSCNITIAVQIPREHR
jgi:hypothetical protein